MSRACLIMLKIFELFFFLFWVIIPKEWCIILEIFLLFSYILIREISELVLILQ